MVILAVVIVVITLVADHLAIEVIVVQEAVLHRVLVVHVRVLLVLHQEVV